MHRICPASQLLNHIMENARQDSSVKEVYLHVQTSNLTAKDFYLSHGFEEAGVVKDYYTRVDPPDAFILRKQVVREEAAEEQVSGAAEEKS
jgi:ribosomal protein S18 acetylase RimI-like enzyme